MEADAPPEIPSAYSRGRQRALIQWFALLLALALLAGVIGINLFVDYGGTEARARERLSTQARIIALNMEQQLATANRALEGLLGDLSVWRDSHDRLAHIEYIRAVAKAMPGIRSIGIVDADGVLVASNHVGVLGTSFAHRSYFQTAKWRADGETLYISPPFQSMLGADAVTMTRTALGTQGEFKGIVYATLDSDYFQTLMASVLYAPDMWDAAAHADGSVFLSVPEQRHGPSNNANQPGTFFTRHKESGKMATVLTGRLPENEHVQIVAQYTIDPVELHMDKPLIIAAGRSRDVVFLSWRRSALLQSALFLIITLTTVWGLNAYQRRQRAFDRKEARAHKVLRASEENYRLIVENTKDAVVKLDANGICTYVNPAYASLFGVGGDYMAGKYYWHHVIAEDRAKADAFFESLFHPPHAGSISVRENTFEGLRHLQWTAHALLDEHGNISGLISIGRDVTQHVTEMNVLEEQAWRDPLTGLANRRHFMDMGNAELIRTHRYKRPLSLLTLDMDHFKNINDTHGHQAGDLVLQRFAGIVAAVIRDVDIAGRIGGEEFAILLPETDTVAALGVAERLHKAIRSSEIPLRSGATLRFTASIGIAAVDDAAATLDALLERADQALYQAKRSGRNTTSVSVTAD